MLFTRLMWASSGLVGAIAVVASLQGAAQELETPAAAASSDFRIRCCLADGTCLPQTWLECEQELNMDSPAASSSERIPQKEGSICGSDYSVASDAGSTRVIVKNCIAPRAGASQAPEANCTIADGDGEYAVTWPIFSKQAGLEVGRSFHDPIVGCSYAVVFQEARMPELAIGGAEPVGGTACGF